MEEGTQALICPRHTVRYITVFVAGVIFGGVIAGAVSFVYFNRAIASGANTYQAGFDAAKKLVQESEFGGAFRSVDDIRAISGAVIDVSGGNIVIDTKPQNLFDDVSLSSRTVIVTENTKITKKVYGDVAAFQSAMDAYIKSMRSGKKTTTEVPRMAEPTYEIISISDIKEGASIVVIARENIKSAAIFSASEIIVQ